MPFHSVLLPGCAILVYANHFEQAEQMQAESEAVATAFLTCGKLQPNLVGEIYTRAGRPAHLYARETPFTNLSQVDALAGRLCCPYNGFLLGFSAAAHYGV